MVVQHNMQASNANRQLGITTSAQAKSTEKLSSGYKINRAADDAAGLSFEKGDKVMSILAGKKCVIIGDRDGIPGQAIAACAESAGAEVVFSSTECFV